MIGFGEELVEAGYTVVMPHLFGEPERPMTRAVDRVAHAPGVRLEGVHQAGDPPDLARSPAGCASLARELHAELGGPGVGALGMCFTGGFALAMMVDDSVAAPVLAQPSAPFAVSPSRSRDLNLSDADLAKVKARAAAGCEVLGLRYRADPAVGKRFQRLTEEIGDEFIKVELAGKGHSTVTAQRSQEAVDAVLSFFGEKLSG